MYIYSVSTWTVAQDLPQLEVATPSLDVSDMELVDDSSSSFTDRMGIGA